MTPDYFRVLGLTLLEGRLLDERDALRENLETVVVDRAWAQAVLSQRERHRQAIPRRRMHELPVDDRRRRRQRSEVRRAGQAR